MHRWNLPRDGTRNVTYLETSCLLSRFHLSPPPSPPLPAHWSLPAAAFQRRKRARPHPRQFVIRTVFRTSALCRFIQQHRQCTTIHPRGTWTRLKSQAFEETSRMNGARNWPHVGRWSSREEERGDGDKRGGSRKGNVNEGCHCFLGCQNPRARGRSIPRPVTRISPLCAPCASCIFIKPRHGE